MLIADLYDNIFDLIVQNNNILYYLGIDENSSNLDKALKIQKRAKPQSLIDTIPLIAFYAPPGVIDPNNSFTYRAPFVFDIYTNDDVDLALRIASELTKSVDKKLLPFCGVDSLESRVITAHESNVDEENIYCFTVALEFSILTDS